MHPYIHNDLARLNVDDRLRSAAGRSARHPRKRRRPPGEVGAALSAVAGMLLAVVLGGPPTP
jgi:hypothetical protein